MPVPVGPHERCGRTAAHERVVRRRGAVALVARCLEAQDLAVEVVDVLGPRRVVHVAVRAAGGVQPPMTDWFVLGWLGDLAWAGLRGVRRV